MLDVPNCKRFFSFKKVYENILKGFSVKSRFHLIFPDHDLPCDQVSRGGLPSPGGVVQPVLRQALLQGGLNLLQGLVRRRALLDERAALIGSIWGIGCCRGS